MTTVFKIIEKPPYDKSTPSTFWIKRETVRFGFIKSSSVLGDYKYDNSYGELGDCPFFDRKSAEKRVEILKELL